MRRGSRSSRMNRRLRWGVWRLRRRICLHQHRKNVSFDAVAYPGLGAVDDVVLAVPYRFSADRLQVRAAVRFGQCDAAAQLAAGKARQVVALGLGEAKVLDGAFLGHHRRKGAEGFAKLDRLIDPCLHIYVAGIGDDRPEAQRSGSKFHRPLVDGDNTTSGDMFSQSL